MTEKENPFRYGEEVTGEYFCNRRDEIQQLASYIKASNKVLLYSPRRWGKTSLIKEVLSRLPKKQYIVIYADLYPVLKEEHFNQIVAQSFAASLASPAHKVVKTIRSMLGSFIPKITIDPMGQTGFEFGFDSSKKGTALAEELIDAIAKHAARLKKRGIVVLDEFQQIGELADDRLEKVLRSKIQSQRHMSYIFAGSKRHLLVEMFSNPSRPFYKSAVHFPLNPMPKDELKKFILERFEHGGFDIDGTAVENILEIAEGHPYHTQQLCFHVWECAGRERRVGKDLVSVAVSKILSTENASYHNMWGMLTKGQRLTLKGLSSLQEGEAPFSAAFLRKAGISSADSFRKALELLVTKEIVEKENGGYKISDVFFKHWLTRN